MKSAPLKHITATFHATGELLRNSNIHGTKYRDGSKAFRLTKHAMEKMMSEETKVFIDREEKSIMQNSN